MNIDISPADYNVDFRLQDFFIEDLDDVKRHVPAYVFESVIKFYLIPLNFIRKELGIPIYVSRSSCFRSVYHEEKRGRNGLSAHTFGTYSEAPHPPERKGACDITLLPKHQDRFAELGIWLAKMPYKRICIYPNNNFYHVDFKAENKYFYQCETPTSNWKPIRFEQMVELAQGDSDD